MPALASAPAYDMPPPATSEGRTAAARQKQGQESGRTVIIQKLEAILPNVKDGQGFMDSMKGFLEQFDA